MTVPKLIFLVPYRDREMQQQFFDRHMKTYILEDLNSDSYKIYYIHQNDKRAFNRGAIKNIGFNIMKQKYKEDYKNITFVFNDVDTAPLCPNIFHYHTQPNIIKHFYGYKHALGGIFSIKGSDFEKTNGFPNYWSWGYEDSVLQKRAELKNINIDRREFLPILHKNVLFMHDDIHRAVNRKEFDRFTNNMNDGLLDINDLEYTIDESSGFVNVTNFTTPYKHETKFDKQLDLRKGGIPYQSNNMSMKFI
tara:strand:+ start:67 stop:813 length:747 start_codon:yes stop_codon:yes gene_type:complete